MMQFLKIFAGIIYYLLVLALVLIIGGAIFFATGNRDVSIFNAYIASKIEKNIKDIHINIDKSYIHLDIKSNNLALTTNNVELFADDRRYISFSDVKFNFNPFNLFEKNKKVMSIDFGAPEFDLPKFYTQAVGPDKKSPLAALHDILIENSALIKELDINIDDIQLDIDIKDKKLPFYIANLEIKVDNDDRVISFTTNLIYNFDGSYGSFDIELYFDENKDLKIVGTGYDIESSFLNQFINTDYQIGDLNAKFNFLFDVTIDQNLNIPLVTVDGVAHGHFTNSEFIDKDLFISEAKYQLILGDNFQDIITENFEIYTSDFSAKGTVKFTDNEFQSNLYFHDLSLFESFELFPERHIDKLKLWLKKNVWGGDIKEANLDINFRIEDDVIKRSNNQPYIELLLPLENGKIQYLQGVPPFEGIKAQLKLTEKEFIADVTHGKIGDFTVKNILLTNAYKDNNLGIKFQLNTALNEQIQLLNKIYKLDFIPTDIKGENLVKTAVDINIPLKSKDTQNDSLYKAKMTFDGHSMPISNFKHTLHLQNLEIKYHQQNIDFDVAAKFQDVPTTINYHHDLKDKSKNINFSANLNYNKLQEIVGDNLNIIIPNYGQGLVKVSGHNDNKQTELQLDFTEASVKIPELKYTKTSGKDAILKLGIAKSNYDFNLYFPYFTGYGTFKLVNNHLSEFTAKNVRLYQGDFNVNYKIHDTNKSLEIKGKAFDLQNVKLNDIIQTLFVNKKSISKEDENIFKQAKGINTKSTYNLDIENVILANNTSFKNFKLHSVCSQQKCAEIKLNTLMAATNFIALEVNKDKLQFTTNDASYIAKALGHDELFLEGVLKIRGLYNKDGSLDGELEMHGFYLRNIPAIIKFFSITGIPKAIGGKNYDPAKGTLFQNLKCSINHKDNVFSMNDCLAVSHILRIKADGYLNFAEQYMKFKGLLINEDILSDIVRKIPIIGYTLGKDESLIATRFKVQGPFNDIQASVNPLSTLAPGFLREIFE